MSERRHVARWLLRRAAGLGLALFPLFGSGCLYLGESRQTDFDESKRTAVRFATARAARQFHDGFRSSDREAHTDHDAFVMPFLVAQGEWVYHETAHYNAEVRLADVDRDGSITEEEAHAYLEHVKRAAAGGD